MLNPNGIDNTYFSSFWKIIGTKLQKVIKKKVSPVASEGVSGKGRKKTRRKTREREKKGIIIGRRLWEERKEQKGEEESEGIDRW